MKERLSEIVVNRVLMISKGTADLSSRGDEMPLILIPQMIYFRWRRAQDMRSLYAQPSITRRELFEFKWMSMKIPSLINVFCTRDIQYSCNFHLSSHLIKRELWQAEFMRKIVLKECLRSANGGDASWRSSSRIHMMRLRSNLLSSGSLPLLYHCRLEGIIYSKCKQGNSDFSSLSSFPYPDAARVSG